MATAITIFYCFRIQIVFLCMRQYPHNESNIRSSQTSTNLQHQVFTPYMAKLETQNTIFGFFAEPEAEAGF